MFICYRKSQVQVQAW